MGWIILSVILILIIIFGSKFEKDPSNNIKYLKEQKEQNQNNNYNENVIKCPKCGSTQIQLMKRGWKITTGFLGSSKNERVCIACKHRF